jgi:hypothetical protein
MPINLSLNVRCPYCGLENIVPLDIDSRFIPKQIVTCDTEIGGCDKDFVIDPHFEITADVYKIEGKYEYGKEGYVCRLKHV